MKQDKESLAKLVISPDQSRFDPLVAWMQGQGIELTMANYLDLAYPTRDFISEPLLAEEILELPNYNTLLTKQSNITESIQEVGDSVMSKITQKYGRKKSGN